jgi:acyl dehydratase
MTFRYFEDFAPGDSIALGPYPVTAAEIVEFAEQFDPAPFHLSEAAARDSLVGGLCASGWHCCAMAMRMMCDAFLLDSTGQGAPGIECVRWRAPVRPGDTLTGNAFILDAKPSRSRPEIGFVKFTFEFYAGGAEPVFTVKNSIMFRRREALRQQEEAMQQ